MNDRYLASERYGKAESETNELIVMSDDVGRRMNIAARQSLRRMNVAARQSLRRMNVAARQRETLRV
jgi:CHASE3 domain sensor protein